MYVSLFDASGALGVLGVSWMSLAGCLLGDSECHEGASWRLLAVSKWLLDASMITLPRIPLHDFSPTIRSE